MTLIPWVDVSHLAVELHTHSVYGKTFILVVYLKDSRRALTSAIGRAESEVDAMRSKTIAVRDAASTGPGPGD